MPVVLGPNRYGKAETRLVRVTRDGGVHHLKDLNVSTALSGDMEDAHLTGDNSAVLPTDTQKNTVYAFARRHGVDQIEEFALLLARHHVGSQPPIRHARVEIEEYSWDRITPAGDPGDRRHSFVRSGAGVRTCVVHHDADGRTTVVSGLADLTVMNTTGSEFHGFARDEYTTLAPATDRILATAVTARWRHASPDPPPGGSYAKSHAEVRRCLLEAFAQTHSLSLQQTLYAMGRRALETRPEICEVRLALPNRHHFPVDLEPFGLDNPGEVFYAADRPYGLIEGAVLSEGAPGAGFAWD
ncbi:factor-independent urate hydroxylase [Planomonospora parontospora]|uniref:factor-independent urate hydroxylase n=1 Tax=Planomonospora parontospora TaxID=58119 RepID=UPI00167140CB|nr:urate oxidase [Planomonospora parontospora]GGL04674.1 uricase [Planomonospora parontospora subsp. antibiotica]GII13520.1 uricase [Planomonospora parontospora subsp. antibiotica]